jgi:hypothetical protein
VGQIVDRTVFELVESPFEDGVVRVRVQVDLDLSTVPVARQQLVELSGSVPVGDEW